MSNKFEIPILTTEEHKQGKFSEGSQNIEINGKITGVIGTGQNAKDSLIYLTLKWAFISGCVLTSLICINNWFFVKEDNNVDMTSSITKIWEIIIPVITLALGYAFGKSHK
jgi:hypothetical protein